MRLLKPREIVEGMRVQAIPGFPCRQWLRPLDKPYKSPLELMVAQFQPAPEDALPDGLMNLLVVWVSVPYAIVEYQCPQVRQPPYIARAWIDTREVELFDGEPAE